MALQFMDNFSQYGVTEDNLLDGVYADKDSQNGVSVSLATDPDGVSSGTVIALNRGRLRRVLSSSQTTVGVAFRYWMDELPGSEGNQSKPIIFTDGLNAQQCYMVVRPTGALAMYRGSTLLAASSGPSIVAAAWNHIEVKVVFSLTVGTVEVRVNGVSVINATGLNTCNAGAADCSNVSLSGNSWDGNGNDDGFAKDLVIWDATGSVNNDFVGDCQVVSLIPDGDDTLNWAVSTGSTGYNLIDETTPNDTDYISADSSPPASSVFTLTNLDPEVVTVKGLMTFCRAFKTDGGTANLQVSLISGASTDSGADRPVTTAATVWTDISELDPATAAAWTPIAVNAVKLEIDRTV